MINRLARVISVTALLLGALLLGNVVRGEAAATLASRQVQVYSEYTSVPPATAPAGATSWSGATAGTATAPCVDNQGNPLPVVVSQSGSLTYSETWNNQDFVSGAVHSHIQGAQVECAPPRMHADYALLIHVTNDTPINVSGSVAHGSAGCGGGGSTVLVKQLGGANAQLFQDQTCAAGTKQIAFSGTLFPGDWKLWALLNGQTGSFDSSADVTFTLGSVTPSALTIGDAADTEGNAGTKVLTFPVTLSPAATSTVTVSFGTQDGIATVADGDYNAASGFLNFAPGETSKLVSVQMRGDTKAEPNETFAVLLSNPSSNSTISMNTATGTIINDDVAIDFDWTVPDRFGFDQNGDHLIDYYPTDGSLVVAPARWRVDFGFTLAGACPSGLSQKWTVNGTAIPPSDLGILLDNAAACKFSYGFPREDTFQVQLELRDSTGSVLGQKQKAVIVQDWLIVSIGDSVASGEGNPDEPGPVWEDRQCHRTSAAGPAQAALAIERADPKTSVTFIHLACSGATINEGLLGRYEGQEPGRPLQPQVQAMDLLVGNREIDAVLVSIGANDVEFSTIVTECFLRTDCNVASNPRSMAVFFNNKLTGLAPAYDALGAKLKSGLRHPVKPERTYITEYFDPTRDERGAFCDNKILEEAADFPRLGITAAEAEWASTEMLVRLNQAVAAAAARNNWHFVGGTTSDFQNHGYCAVDSQRWIVQVTESLRNQHNKDGTIHPNRAGHLDYGSHLSTALTADFYTAGDLNKPRAPLTSP